MGILAGMHGNEMVIIYDLCPPANIMTMLPTSWDIPERTTFIYLFI